MKAFHNTIFIPQELLRKIPSVPISLNYGPHAKEEAQVDILGPVENLPSVIDITRAHIVEIVTSRKGIHKIVLKLPIDNEKDLTLVINKDNVTKVPNTWFVRTVWVNKKEDRHRQVPVFKYVSKNDWEERNVLFKKKRNETQLRRK